MFYFPGIFLERPNFFHFYLGFVSWTGLHLLHEKDCPGWMASRAAALESMNLNLKQQGGPRSRYKIYKWSEMGRPPISRVFSPQLCIYNKAIYMGYTSIY